MVNPFSSSFLNTAGKLIAFLVVIVIVSLLIFFGYKFYKKDPQPKPPTNTNIINKPEYKPGNVISTVKPNELKVNHEKLTSFIDSNDAIISDYYK